PTVLRGAPPVSDLCCPLRTRVHQSLARNKGRTLFAACACDGSGCPRARMPGTFRPRMGDETRMDDGTGTRAGRYALQHPDGVSIAVLLGVERDRRREEI